MEIHQSARRHGVADDDIAHAYKHAIAWVELGEEPDRWLVVGPDRSGNLIEFVVLDTGGRRMVIHAMALRRSTERELFGDGEQ